MLQPALENNRMLVAVARLTAENARLQRLVDGVLALDHYRDDHWRLVRDSLTAGAAASA